MTDLSSLEMTLPALRQAYANGLTPGVLIEEVLRRIELANDNPIWISILDRERLQPYITRLQGIDPESLPLYGVPFAIKDNIDLAGVPTTAACEAFAHVPDESAFVVSLLIDAGAIPIGKTNLDQFATGLVGTRSPYGAVQCAFSSEHISGGSSSGSAVSVALGQVSFSLGTDTAGSGRVPAAFNNLVGLKATRGLLSTRGVVPACRTLDVVSIFANTVSDAERVFSVAGQFDAVDAYARPAAALVKRTRPMKKIGVPVSLEFFGNADYETMFRAATTRLELLDVEIVPVDCTMLFNAARLLYEGAWVAERYHAARTLIEEQPEALREEFLAITRPAAGLSAVDYFEGAYQLAGYQRETDSLFEQIDALVLPTAPRHFTLAEIAEQPLARNAELGTYTNFMNLLDLCGIAVPSGFTEVGLPFGITLIGDTGSDRTLLQLAQSFLSIEQRRIGAGELIMSEPVLVPGESETVAIAVCGAHLSGMPLNSQLTDRSAALKEATTSADSYRLYALPGGPPFRPGMVRDEKGGAAIEVEVWNVPLIHVGTFLAGIPAPLGLGKVELASGEWVTGFICEPCGLEGADDITELGSWRRYMAEKMTEKAGS